MGTSYCVIYNKCYRIEMKHLKAYLQRFWHSFMNGHRMVNSGKCIRVAGLFDVCIERTYIGCECGKKWFSKPEGEKIKNEMDEFFKSVK